MFMEGFATVILALLSGILTLMLFLMILIVCMIALASFAVLLKRVDISGTVKQIVKTESDVE